jgi:4'-phosphopantetheinyl transferase
MNDKNVCVYRAELPESPLQEHEWLDLGPAESTHARKMADAERRIEYVRARRLMKWSLSHFLGCPMGHIEISTSSLQKPYLVKPLDPEISGEVIEFNQSHTDGLWVMAIARDRRVGVDIESLHRKVKPEVFQRMAHPSEWRTWQSLAEPQQNLSALRTWCQKEALLKGIGLGLARNPRDVLVEVDLEMPVGFYEFVGRPLEENNWKLSLISDTGDHLAIVAAEGFDWLIQKVIWIKDPISLKL